MSKRIGTATIPKDDMIRSENPTRQQQIYYWRLDHGIRVQTIRDHDGNRHTYVVLRKRGQRAYPPMTWDDLVKYVQAAS